MPRYPLVAFALLFCLLCPPVWSAEIPVAPGTGTLNAAAASASPGDTLVLQEGSYAGDTSLTKSLTIRPVARGTHAFITGTLTAAADGISVTVQGLKFTQNFLVTQHPAAVRLLENDFTAGNILITGPIGSSAVVDAAPALVIVGNGLTGGGIINEGADYGSGASYIAGNTLYGGSIGVYSPSSIVGNDLRGGPNTIIHARGGLARILANRVYSTAEIYTSPRQGVIYTTSAYSLVADNIIEVQSTGSYQIAIATAGTGYATITNNIIRGLGSPRSSSWAIYSSSGVSRVSGNIIMDFAERNNSPPINVTSVSQDISNNLCYNGSVGCPAGGGNLNADPKFVDLVGYRLAPDSPAIDAGPADDVLADLDRTRNDMGAYGGPWEIGQYDLQRGATNYAPYVYPLIRWDWSPAGGVSGSLEVQALGVARLR
ncbi:hypothetical protein [uncultured Thiodictyon sp.]|uniref:hypothetical protein n=1 Tax=uncultured Thiodictyon sp. TaxID=1846217 RepID=UPI0025E1E49F|nr:hypothetical protein [uncultured Thiodictyon sp.]